jgi:hypothetical protein
MDAPQNQEALSEWVRQQFQNANKYLAENGVIYDSVIVEESRYFAPYFAIWKIKSLEGEYFWVLVGDLPSDFSPISVAPDAREAMRHFSLSWQLTSENLLKQDDVTQEQKDHANILINRAEGLYGFYKQEDMWQAQ